MNLPIKFKIALIAAISIVSFSAYLFFIQSVSNDNAAQLTQLKQNFFPILEHADNNIMRLKQIKDLLSNAAAANEEEWISETAPLAKQTQETFNHLKMMTKEQNKKRILNKLSTSFEKYYTPRIFVILSKLNTIIQ